MGHALRRPGLPKRQIAYLAPARLQRGNGNGHSLSYVLVQALQVAAAPSGAVWRPRPVPGTILSPSS